MPPNHNPDDNTDDDAPDDHSESDDSPGATDEKPTGIIDHIRSLLEELAAIEQEEEGHRRRSDHIERGRTRIDYTYDVTVGLGDRLPPTRDDPRSDQPSGEPHLGSNQNQERNPEQAIHVETREAPESDELIVIADLPDVTDDELDIELLRDPPAIELTNAEGVIDRIPLDQADVTIMDVSLNNQILKIRLARPPASNGGKHE